MLNFKKMISCLKELLIQWNLWKRLCPLHLRVLKNLSVIKKCPLLGGSLTKIVTFETNNFVRCSRHVHYLGCPLLGGFTVIVAWILPYQVHLGILRWCCSFCESFLWLSVTSHVFDATIISFKGTWQVTARIQHSFLCVKSVFPELIDRCDFINKLSEILLCLEKQVKLSKFSFA